MRAADLVGYQSEAYAGRFLDELGRVAEAEARVRPGSARLTTTAARGLHKLMAYKDEYEVARLHRSAAFKDALVEQFGPEAQITYKLHPPILRRLGVDHKIGLGRSGEAAFAALARMKRLRGTAADPFGRTQHRQLERALIGEYEGMVDKVLRDLSAETYDRAVEVAELPDIVRGYEGIKEANIAQFRERAQHLLGQ